MDITQTYEMIDFSIGVQVAAARPGTVTRDNEVISCLILDVVVKHSDNVTPKQASDIFKQVIETPSTTTRVQNILQVPPLFPVSI